MSLLEEVQKLLEGEKITRIAEETGISYQWIWLLTKGRIKNPGVVNLEKLKTYLTK